MTDNSISREQVRAVFNAEVEKAKAVGDEDRVAKVELMREYFTNPAFRKAMEDFVWSRVQQMEVSRAG